MFILNLFLKPINKNGLKLLNHFLLLPLLSFLVLNTACTRKNNDYSRLQISLPKKQQLLKLSEAHFNKQKTESNSNAKSNSKSASSQKVYKQCAACDVAHVVFNVSGPGISPNIICSLDQKHAQAQGPCNITPDNISIEIPYGDSRLFQVAIALQDLETNELIFFYGDSNAVNIAAGTNPTIAINVDVMSTANGLEGEIKGRYLTDATSGPTGVLEMSLQPPNNKPAMTVVKREMFNGYFKIFALGGVPFNYLFNGKSLFDGPKTLEDFIYMDTSDTDRFASLVKTDEYTGQTRYTVMGFFGPGANTQIACEQSTCTGTEFVDYLRLTATQSSQFMAPFKLPTNANNLFNLSGTTFNWSYLPGVSDVIDGVRIIYIPDVTAAMLQPFYLDDNQIDCAGLLKIPSAVDKGIIPSSTTTFDLGFAPPATSVIFACPAKGSVTFNSAISYPKSNSEGPGNTNQKYLRMEISGGATYNQDGYSLTLNECYPVRFNLYQGQGTAINYTDPTNSQLPLTINTSNIFAGGEIQTTCGGTAVTMVSLPDGQQQSPMYYFKSTAVGVFNPNITVNDTEITFNGIHNQIDVGRPVIYAQVPTHTLTGQCVAINLSKLKHEGGAYNTGYPTVNLSDMADFYLRQSSDCTTGNSVTLSSNQNVYFKLMSAATIDLTNYISATGYDTLVSNLIQPDSGTRVASGLVLSSLDSLEIGKCSRLTIGLVNSYGVPLAAPHSLDIDLATENIGPKIKGQFFYNSDCNSSPISDSSPLSLGQGMMFRDFYVKPLEVSNYFRIFFQSGSYVKKGGVLDGADSFTEFSVAAPNTGNFIFLDIPRFNGKRFVGDHEFVGSQIIVPLHVPAGAVVDCEINSYQPADSTFDSNPGCDSLVTGGNTQFTWVNTDAVSGNQFWFRSKINGQPNQYFNFHPLQIHPLGFKVFHCDYVGASAFGGLSTITSPGTSVNGTHCLESGQAITVNTSGGLNLYNNSRILGHSNGSSVITNQNTSNGYTISLPTSGDIVIANATIHQTNASTLFYTASPLATVPTYIYISDLNYDLANNVGSGNFINALNAYDPDIYFELTSNRIHNTSGTFNDNLIYLTGVSQLKFSRNKILSASQNAIFNVLNSSASGAYLYFKNNHIEIPINFTTNSSYYTNVQFKNNFQAYSGNYSHLLMTTGLTSFDFIGNVFHSNLISGSHILFFDAVNSLNVNFYGNKIISNTSSPYGLDFSGAASMLTVNTFMNNHFVCNNNVNQCNYAINANSTYNLSTGFGAPSATTFNYVCSSSNTYNWSGVTSGGGANTTPTNSDFFYISLHTFDTDTSLNCLTP